MSADEEFKETGPDDDYKKAIDAYKKAVKNQEEFQGKSQQEQNKILETLDLYKDAKECDP